MRADEGFCRVVAKVSATDPFHQFVQGRGRQHDVQGHEKQPAPAQRGKPQQHFADRPGHQQPVTQMHQPVVVVTVQAKALVEADPGQFRTPTVVRHQGIGVMSSQFVDAQEHEHQGE
ncbi:hypothetical protein D3C73_1065870 [compost metagenome]